MSYIILEHNDIDINVFDGMVENHISTGYQNGVGKGILNGCTVSSTAGAVSIATGYIYVCGVRVLITGLETFNMPAPAAEITEQHIVLSVTYANGETSAEFLRRPRQVLTQNDILKNGSGKYEYEMVTFDFGPSGISNVVTAFSFIIIPREDIKNIYIELSELRNQLLAVSETADQALAGVSQAEAAAGSAQASADAAQGQAQASALSAAEAAQYAKEIADSLPALYEAIVDREGTKAYIDGVGAPRLDFTADPQEQLNDLDTRLEDMAAQSEPITGEMISIDETTAEGVISDLNVPKGKSTQKVTETGINKLNPNAKSESLWGGALAIGTNTITISNGDNANEIGATPQYKIKLDLKPNTDYVLSMEGYTYVGSNIQATLMAIERLQNTGDDTGIGIATLSKNVGGNFIAFNSNSLLSGGYQLRLFSGGTDKLAGSRTFTKVQINEGTVQLPYEAYIPTSPSPEAPSPIIDTETLMFRDGNKNRINIMDGTIRTTPAAGLTYTRADGLLTINGTKSGNTEASVITDISALLAAGTYNISVTCFSGTRPNGYIVLYLYDGAGNRIVSLDSNGSANLSFNRNFTLASDVVIKEIRWGTVNSNVIYDNYTIGIQVKHGAGMDGFTVAESYVYPYALTDGANNYALRSLPDGTADSISADGVLQQRVKRTVIASVSNVSFWQGGSSDDRLDVTIKDTDNKWSYQRWPNTAALLCNIAQSGFYPADSIACAFGKYETYTGLVFGTRKSYWQSLGYSLDTAGAQAFIADCIAAAQAIGDPGIVFEYPYGDAVIPAPIQLSAPLPKIPTYDGQTNIWTDEGVTLDSKLWRHGLTPEPMLYNKNGTYAAASKYTFFEDGSTLDGLKALLIPDLLYDKDTQPNLGAGSYPNGIMGGISLGNLSALINKYKRLRVYCKAILSNGIGEFDPNLPTSSNPTCCAIVIPSITGAAYFYRPFGPTGVLTFAVCTISGTVLTDKNNDSAYYVYRIEGVKI